jgi:hypothetical protein
MIASRQTAEAASSIPVRLSSMRFVVVTLGARLLAFDAEAVKGSLATGDGGAAEGVIAEGILYKSVDLSGRMALPTYAGDLNGPVLLLSQGGLYGCIRVDRIYEPVERAPSQVLPLPPHFQGAEQQWYRGMILFEQSVAMVLKVEWVLEEAMSGQDAANLDRPPETQETFAEHRSVVSRKVQEC